MILRLDTDGLDSLPTETAAGGVDDHNQPSSSVQVSFALAPTVFNRCNIDPTPPGGMTSYFERAVTALSSPVMSHSDALIALIDMPATVPF